MSADQVTETIKPLAREASAPVRASFEELVTQRQLTPEELGQLAQQMVDATDQAERERLKELLIEGFYGRSVDA